MADAQEFGYDYAQKQMDRQQNPLRKLVKSFYVSRVLRHVQGPSLDLGCGAGQILARLPPGSAGMEVNPYLVADLRQRGFEVMPVTESGFGLSLAGVAKNRFTTLVLSHVLEHFDHADQVLRQLLQDCAQLGISNVVIVVPGQTGYRSDPTHKTFVTMAYLESHQLRACEGFKLAHHSYFPGNIKLIEKFFIYHELLLVYKMPCRD